MQSFGRTLNNFYKDYINCSDNRPKSRTEEKLNVGFVPTSKMKLNIKTPQQ